MGRSERELAIEAHVDDIPWTQGGDVATKTKQHQIDSVLFTDSNGQGVGKQRLEEQRVSMNILGMTKLYPVGYERGFIDGTLSSIPFGQLAQVLFYILDEAKYEGRPYTTLRTFNDRGFSGHPDHIALAQVAEYTFINRPEIQQLTTVEMSPLEHRLWPTDYFVTIPQPNLTGCIAVDISQTRHLKVASIEASTSQLRNGGFEQMERVGKLLPPTELYRYTKRA